MTVTMTMTVTLAMTVTVTLVQEGISFSGFFFQATSLTRRFNTYANANGEKLLLMTFNVSWMLKDFLLYVCWVVHTCVCAYSYRHACMLVRSLLSYQNQALVATD